MTENSEEYLTIDIDELARRLKVQKSWIYSRTRVRGPNAFPCHRVGKYLRFVWGEVLVPRNSYSFG